MKGGCGNDKRVDEKFSIDTFNFSAFRINNSVTDGNIDCCHDQSVRSRVYSDRIMEPLHRMFCLVEITFSGELLLFAGNLLFVQKGRSFGLFVM